MQSADTTHAAQIGTILIYDVALKVTAASTLNGLISGYLELGEASFPWEESEPDPTSATDADQYLDMNIELLDAIWQKVVLTDPNYELDLETVVATSALEISKGLRDYIAASCRERTEDLFVVATKVDQ